MPRALDELFERIDRDTSGSTFVVKLSMVEIYMEVRSLTNIYFNIRRILQARGGTHDSYPRVYLLVSRVFYLL